MDRVWMYEIFPKKHGLRWNNDSIFLTFGQIKSLKGTVVNWGMTLCDCKLD